jgi:hypothetical protein
MSAQVVNFRVSELGLRVTETGVRQLDMYLAPMTLIIEGPVSEDRRCFLSGPDGSGKVEALAARLVGKNQARPNFQNAFATIYDTLSATTGLDEREGQPCGRATFSEFRMRITPSAMDELLRQEASGGIISYASISIAGLEHAAGENTEGGLIGLVWPPGEDGHAIGSLQIRYVHSEALSKKPQEPERPTRGDLLSFQAQVLGSLTAAAHRSRRSEWVSTVGTVLVILVLLWKLKG